MQFIKLFLLIGCISITAADPDAVNQLKEYVNWFVKYGEGNPIETNEHEVTLFDECLGTTDNAVIWKALFDGVEVAVKFFTRRENMDNEVSSYKALNAIDNEDIEKYGIPRIYYVGKMFGTSPVIVMTLFDESLFRRWKKQNMYIRTYSNLQVFLQSVKALQYMRSKRVLHNDIKPQNIFLRGNNVFVGDFDLATLNGKQGKGGTLKYASAHKFNNQSRTAMDDLESLIYTFFHMESIFVDMPFGYIVSNQTAKENEAFILEQCEHFQNFPITQKACKFICKDEMLSGRSVPAYKEIIGHLKAAIKEVQEITRQTEFEWITPPPAVPSHLSKALTKSTSAASAPKPKPMKTYNKSISSPAIVHEQEITPPRKSISNLSRVFSFGKCLASE
ncbi:uncharacterized protein LOC116345816 [Contarinia nasturtii]|uniref:uncharacterized protein LOC116345816 n=1 Tax=Contarinia nasturtii TaxID=265458 RepID=UPI0012D47822|nr:uncharacterized protein LOC116345816 [Contarinia nasturtii]